MTRFVTLNELIQRTIRRLSQVPGTSVQTYSEDRIADMLQHKFDVLFDEAWWFQFLYWRTITLDGALGIPTINLQTATNPLDRFEDIKFVMVNDTNRKLTRLPETINPTSVTSNNARWIEEYNLDGRVFRVLPVTSTDTLQLRYRSRPAAFTTNDVVNFDPEALVLGATYDYLEDDGTNPGATAKFLNFFESRVKQLKLMLSQIDHDTDPRLGQTLDEWVEYYG